MSQGKKTSWGGGVQSGRRTKATLTCKGTAEIQRGAKLGGRQIRQGHCRVGGCLPASASCASEGRRSGEPLTQGWSPPPLQPPLPVGPRCRCRWGRPGLTPPLLPPQQRWRRERPPPAALSWPAAARALGPVGGGAGMRRCRLAPSGRAIHHACSS